MSITDHLEQVEKTAQSNKSKIEMLELQLLKMQKKDDQGGADTVSLGDLVVKNQAKIERIAEEVNKIIDKLQKLGLSQNKLVLDDNVSPGVFQSFIDTWA